MNIPEISVNSYIYTFSCKFRLSQALTPSWAGLL